MAEFECFNKYRVMKTHKEIADNGLFKFNAEAEKLGLLVYLKYGTCLGFVRDGGYIEFDNDVDLGVQCSREEWDQFLVLLREAGFVFVDNDYGGHMVKDDIMFDVSRTDGVKHRHECTKFEVVEYEGKKFFVPSPVNNYLEEIYGDWKTRRYEGKYRVYGEYGVHVASQRHEKKRTWNAVADDWREQKSKYEKELSPFQVAEREKFVSALDNTTVLDVGCGQCGDLEYFMDKGIKCVGVDFSVNMIKACENVVLGSVLNLPFLNESFDGAWCNSVLKHLHCTDLFQCLKEVYRVLREEGVFWAGLDEGSGEVVEELGSEQIKFNLYSEEEFTRYVEAVGFNILEVTKKTAWRNFIMFLMRKQK